MDRRQEDRERRDREDRERREREGSFGRGRLDQHEQERARYRQSDDYMHGHEHERGGESARFDTERDRTRSWEHGGANPRGGANDRARFDYGRAEEGPTRGRYEYGADEDRRLWGEPRPGDGEGYSRVGDGPRREEPYRSPSDRDDYGMFREGNHSGYDTWHGHNYFKSHNDADAMGSREISSWQRSEPGREGRSSQERERGRFDDRESSRRGEQGRPEYRRGDIASPPRSSPEEGRWEDYRSRDEQIHHNGGHREQPGHVGESRRRDDRRFDERRGGESRYDDRRFDDRRFDERRGAEGRVDRRSDEARFDWRNNEGRFDERRYEGGFDERRGDERRYEAGFDQRRADERRYEGGFDQRHADERRGEGRPDDRRDNERRAQEGSGNRDISRTWRMFDSWGDTDYSRQRGQGFGWHRGDDYGDHWGSTNERSRDD